LNRTERSRARAAAADQTFKIRKGKKDITEKAVPDSMTRQARFYNPNFSHGKKSLVYQMKTGQLRDKLKELKEGERGLRTRTSSAAITKSAFDDAFKGQSPFGRGDDGAKLEPRAPRAARGSDRPKPRVTGNWADQGSEGYRPSRETRRRDTDEAVEESGTRQRSDFASSRERRTTERPSAFAIRDRPGRQQDDFREPRRSRETFGGGKEERRWSPDQHKEFHRSREQAGPRDDKRRVNRDQEQEAPVSVQYTTAASQFLYGKSVVEAALKTSARKLYKLYVYAGANRENVDVDEIMIKLARKKGIPVRNVQEREARLMEKMSGGRPHNGYVLEASPIPQLPVNGLGPFEETKERSGFRIELAHQSAEDAMVNGTEDFVRTPPSSHKPLVVVLDQIIDPQNLGAILRSVNFLGATAVAITKRNSATLTPVALKASAGASEAVTLFSVDNLAPFLDNSKENGWKVYTAVPPTSSAGKHRQMSVYEVEEQDPLSKEPCILLLGGEGEGLSKQLKSKADVEVNIRNMSQTNLVDSLNVSVAAGLLTASLLRGKAKAETEASEKKRQTLSLF
jgi:21S rRNA (GM2251-2'-O)-methyltransferase